MPVRTCVACREKFEKAQLLRWVVEPSGVARPDPRAKRPGRGGYVCRSEECFEKLLARSKKRGGPDFRAHVEAFHLAIRGDVVQNVPVETHEN